MDLFEFLKSEAEGWERLDIIVIFRVFGDAYAWFYFPLPDRSGLEKVLEENGETLGFVRYNTTGPEEYFFQARLLSGYRDEAWAHELVGEVLDTLCERLGNVGFDVDPVTTQ